jgi:hypothetical protein
MPGRDQSEWVVAIHRSGWSRSSVCPAVSEPAEPDQLRILLRVASRSATVVGVSAIVAFVFLVLVPKSQKSDATELGLSEHRALPSAGAAESQTLLEKFVQWKQTQ